MLFTVNCVTYHNMISLRFFAMNVLKVSMKNVLVRSALLILHPLRNKYCNHTEKPKEIWLIKNNFCVFKISDLDVSDFFRHVQFLFEQLHLAHLLTYERPRRTFLPNLLFSSPQIKQVWRHTFAIYRSDSRAV